MLEVIMLQFRHVFFIIFIIKTVIGFDIEEFFVEVVIFVLHFLFLLFNLIFEVIFDLDGTKLECDVGVEFERDLILQLFSLEVKDFFIFILNLDSQDVEILIDKLKICGEEVPRGILHRCFSDRLQSFFFLFLADKHKE